MAECSSQGKSYFTDIYSQLRRNTAALTVAAERPPVGGHGAVTRESLPQLQTHSLVVAGVLCTGGAGTCRVQTADLAGALSLYFYAPSLQSKRDKYVVLSQ